MNFLLEISPEAEAAVKALQQQPKLLHWWPRLEANAEMKLVWSEPLWGLQTA